MPRPIHFDLSADDPARAEKFYSSVFGWKFSKWGDGGPMDYWMIQTGEGPEPGIDGGMSRRGPESGPGANTIGVPNVDDFAAKIGAAGGKVLQPKMAIPGVGWFAFCQDTEGNGFGIMQPDEAAR
ncbi:MAG: VOC family protein [Chloroflexi bacterium]|nr:VOC family protein [Chloroflexota bacterium]